MYRTTYALPVFYDLKINIPLSGPPTQSLITYLYMIIDTWLFQKVIWLVGYFALMNLIHSLGRKQCAILKLVKTIAGINSYFATEAVQ